MLFVLTGEVQIGKTRWLQDVVESLQEIGIVSYGVIAPGIWTESDGQDANDQGLEKLGIDNVLLPQGKRIAFAKRSDLAKKNDTYDKENQSGRAQLGWHISDSAIDSVNEHFSRVRSQSATSELPGILVVDELGRLELIHGGGIIEAMNVLESGPTNTIGHAVVVTRKTLAEEVQARFFRAWGGSTLIAPNDESRILLMQQFNR